MKLSVRIFLAYFILVAVGAYWLLNTVADSMHPSISRSTEDVLVDMSNLIAEVIARDLQNEKITTVAFSNALQRYQARSLNAAIYDIQKTQPDLIIYITDKKGKVVLHSDTKEIGKDYSNWRDVARTLRGEYGARTSRASDDEPLNTVMFVAAPIKWGRDLLGVVSVGKPNLSIQPIIELNKSRIWLKGLSLLALGLVLGLITAILLTGSIRKLTKYVDAVREGERIPVPDLHEKELNRLAQAVDAMRSEIDGKAYVENYIHTLTHEMKSPLATIQGASELLEEDMELNERRRFLTNIRNETDRLRNFIDRLLQLAAVEKKQTLDNTEPLNLIAILEQQLDSKSANLKKKSLTHSLNVFGDKSNFHGERFLIKRAVSNLLDNAIDFAQAETNIDIKLFQAEKELTLKIHNTGAPVPEYARSRLFERFYSLPRPSTGQKSTGLGLSFVKEVASLHDGNIILKNENAGVSAILNFKL